MTKKRCPLLALEAPENYSITRRSFLKGCGSMAAGLGTCGLLGGTARAFASETVLPAIESTAKPTAVGVVKSLKHDLVSGSWKNPFTMYPKGEPPNKLWMPTWTKESEIEIEEMVRQAVKASGDWPIEKGDVVAIKANLVASGVLLMQIGRMSDADMQATVTDARVVRALALMAKESGAKKIYIVANPMVADGYVALRQWGFEGIAKETGAELVGLSSLKYKYYRAPHALALEQYALPTLMVDEVDKVISAASLKTHMNAGITLTLKNIGIGVPTGQVYGGPRIGLPHNKLSEVITDVCSIVKIDYAVIDGIWGMEGAGPINGAPVSMDVIIAGPDPVAVDGVGTEIMGFPKENYGTSRMAMGVGLGTYDKTTVNAVGAPLERIIKQFAAVPKAMRSPATCADVYGWDGWEEPI